MNLASHSDAERLLQLVQAVQAREPLPSDVGAWVVELATAALSNAEREAARNSALRRAAVLAGGNRWRQALDLRTEILLTRREMSFLARNPPAPGSVEALVFEALTIDPDTPASERQLMRILLDDRDA